MSSSRASLRSLVGVVSVFVLAAAACGDEASSPALATGGKAGAAVGGASGKAGGGAAGSSALGNAGKAGATAGAGGSAGNTTAGASGGGGASASGGSGAAAGSSNTAGSSGSAGAAGGASGNAGASGTSGNAGANGTAGTNGVAGTGGTNGTAGTGGTNGTAGTGGTNGTAGMGGANGNAGTSGDAGMGGTGGGPPVCGNAIVEDGEECDNVPGAPAGRCTPACKLVCPYDGVAYQRHCYWSDGVTRQYDAAQKECVSKGGHLAVLSTADENQALKDAKVTPINLDYFIGANDIDTEGTFVWITGETFDYTRWKFKEPDDGIVPGGGGQDCVAYNGATSMWSTTTCKSFTYSICEIDDPLKP